MLLENTIKLLIQKALSNIFGINEAVLIQATKREFVGNYTYVIFPLAKKMSKSPLEIGNAIGNYLLENETLITNFNVVQGFLNISLADSVWIDALNQIVADTNFGQKSKNGESVMIEYSSPNTNKPLHLGHLRNNFLGASLAKILEANGYEVIKTCLVNDRGIHICKSMLAYQKFANGETPEITGIKGDHLVGKYYVAFDRLYKSQIEALVAGGVAEEQAKKEAPAIIEAQDLLQKWEQHDPATTVLWQKMNEWVYEGFNETYQKIGVQFDKTYYESNTYLLGKEIVEEGLTKGIFFKKDNGSVWVDLKAEGLDEKLVLRADGTSVYITQDLGTTDLKFKDFHNKESIWVVGNEQDYHFQVLFAIMKKLGRAYADGCYHLSYGMVDLPSGKMKSREGTVVDADELVADLIAIAAESTKERGKIDDFSVEEQDKLFSMLGLGALKYFLLKVDPKKRMLFNPQESIDFQGNTGPFIQYTHARICSILRKGSAQENIVSDNTIQLHKTEIELVFLLTQYVQSLEMAAKEHSPAIVAQYVYDLAKTYNQFYAEVSILAEPVDAKRILRLNISRAVANTIAQAMGLLGIDVPLKM